MPGLFVAGMLLMIADYLDFDGLCACVFHSLCSALADI